MSIATINQDVARLKQGGQFVNHTIDRRACLDHDHDLARSLERGDQVFDRMSTDEFLALASTVDKLVNLRRRPVEDSHGIAAAFHVENQVFAHDGEADQADVGGRFAHRSSFSINS